ncbi:MAG: N-acetylmuramoyl-L-alanine amidase [Alphaproteobacteria bacterium]|nr:N-acetylmuramoyl-L-alanine amidase [Alphaproteobacteria bacterium]
MIFRSPNFNERDPNVALSLIVLHYTGMKTAKDALTRLCDPKTPVSTHYVIDEDGTTWPLVDEDKRAWHAGESFWKGERDINSASIGIELVNPGHEFGYRSFPSSQINGLISLLHDIVHRRPIDPLTGLLAHSDIAPCRKQDPGELFPWEDLARQKLGLWPSLIEDDDVLLDDVSVAAKLAFLGYDTADLTATLQAFQRRFVSNHITGRAERETCARLNALTRQLRHK